MRGIFTVFAAAILSAFLSACATHESETATLRQAWNSGNLMAAKASVQEVGDVSESSGDALIWHLEKGAVYRANNDLNASVKEFERALEIVKKYEASPEVTLTSETAAALVNQSYIPYRGYAYDKIMLCAYLALNYMELGKFDKAEVALKQMQFFQENAFAKNLEEIEKDEKACQMAARDGGLKKNDVAKTVKNSSLNSQLIKVYGKDFDIAQSPKNSQSARGKYTNAFGYWLAGIYYMARPADGADKSAAADFLRFANESLNQENPELASTANLARNLADGKIREIPPCTFVIFESGSAPFRKQIKFGFPLYVFGDNLPHVSFNLPYLQKVLSSNMRLNFGAKSTENIADFDAIIDTEFKSILPSIILRTITSSAIKAAAQYAAQASVNDTNAKLAIAILGSIYQSVTNDADLRTWTTLPKTISVVQIENPPTAVVDVLGKSVLIDKSGVNVIFVKKMSDTSAVFTRSFTLKK